MMLKMKLLFGNVALVAILSVSACSTVTKVDGNTVASANGKKCKVTVFADKKSAGNYKALSKIETHIKKNMFLGHAGLKGAAYKELKKQACSVGGNGVIVDDFVESKAAEMTHVHVWATVISIN